MVQRSVLASVVARGAWLSHAWLALPAGILDRRLRKFLGGAVTHSLQFFCSERSDLVSKADAAACRERHMSSMHLCDWWTRHLVPTVLGCYGSLALGESLTSLMAEHPHSRNVDLYM